MIRVSTCINGHHRDFDLEEEELEEYLKPPSYEDHGLMVLMEETDLDNDGGGPFVDQVRQAVREVYVNRGEVPGCSRSLTLALMDTDITVFVRDHGRE